MNPKRSGRTSPSIEQEPVPRLPHERDESSDSQIGGEPRPIIQQAHDDVMAGRVDTDRGVPMDQAYKRQKQAAVPSPKK
ncbi:MAG: hypothetical protein H7Y33_09060 [Cytophagales bacterium]|nr:hypothetical protein [Rhizobacter sp.]